MNATDLVQDLLRTRGPVMLRDVTRALGLTPEDASAALDGLVTTGVAEADDDGRVAIYRIKSGEPVPDNDALEEPQPAANDDASFSTRSLEKEVLRVLRGTDEPQTVVDLSFRLFRRYRPPKELEEVVRSMVKARRIEKAVGHQPPAFRVRVKPKPPQSLDATHEAILGVLRRHPKPITMTVLCRTFSLSSSREEDQRSIFQKKLAELEVMGLATVTFRGLSLVYSATVLPAIRPADSHG